MTLRETILASLVILLAPLTMYFAVRAVLPSLTVRVEPRSGAGWSQTFRFYVSSSQGAARVQELDICFGSRVAGPGNCRAEYNAPANVFVQDDAGEQWIMGNLGKLPDVANRQCAFHMLRSRARRISRDVLELTLDVSFRETYSGVRNIFAYAADGELITSWQYIGNWTVPERR
ncbi:MAG TPA: hypothetical protein VEL77_15315 [Rugosimonospora sp.]|nr:hypothetical protein [Rugosimonospora sp.]